MSSLFVVPADVPIQLLPGISSILIAFQIHLLVLERPPETLGKHIVDSTPFAIHTQGNTRPNHLLTESQRGVLRPLVSVNNLGLFQGTGPFQSYQTKTRI